MYRRIITAVLLSTTSLVASAAIAAEPGGRTVGSVMDFGAVGDGQALDTAAIQEAVDAAHHAGGGTVYFPPGQYLCGTIYLKSRVTLEIDAAATLLGSPQLDDYPANRCAFRSYTDKYVRHALIWGENLDDIAIVGRGVIDGQGAAFDGLPWLERPYLIRFVSCRNVVVQDVTLRSSPMWMQHYLACDHVTIRGIHVFNHCNRNNDMIDIDCCRDVVISDCLADTDDDALTFKSTADRPCENVTVNNCVLSSHCNAIKMGTESNGGFVNIAIANCTIRPSVVREARSGRPDGLAGIALEIVDGGTLDGVAIANVTMVGTETPIFMRLGNRARRHEKGAPKPPVGSFSNVVLSNIVATSASATGCSITGLPEHPIRNVTLSSIRLGFVGGVAAEATDRPIPELPEKYPEGSMFGTLPAFGFYCRHVDGLTFRDVDLSFDEPDQRPALVCDDVENLRLDGFQAASAPGGRATILLANVRSALIRGCVAPPHARAFLNLQDRSRRITVTGNDLSAFDVPFAIDPTVDKSALYEAANRP